MRKAPLAVLLSACAVSCTGPALADDGNPTAVPATPCAHAVALAKKAYAPRRWQQGPDARLVAQSRTAMACSPEPAAARRGIARARSRFVRWRTYRRLTPYRGCSGGGKWLTHTAIPGSVVERESGCSWTAVNSSSGACTAYQFIGWTSCDASSWADKMRLHRTARYVLAVQGPAAWSAW